MDILLPEDASANSVPGEDKASTNFLRPPVDNNAQQKQKPLFTVKPGGIAGYLGNMLNGPFIYY